jgi:hypothetical protein
MTKLLPRLGGIAAAAVLLLVVGAGPASANTTSYHKTCPAYPSSQTVVSITAPDTVSATVGSQTQFPVKVSVSGPCALQIVTERIFTNSGLDGQVDGLTQPLGCWGKTLTSGQWCTSQISFVPDGVETLNNEKYVIETNLGEMQQFFTATGVPCRRACLPVVPIGPVKP